MMLSIRKINKFRYIAASIATIILSVPNISPANQQSSIIYHKEEKPISYQIGSAGDKIIHFTSGTGFFVSNNNIVTNEHVVQGCQHIRIRGAVEPGYAELVAIDSASDLALLKTHRTPRMVAPLRGDMPINIGEAVTVMGYPLDRGINGDYLARKAVVTNNHDVYEGVERIQFTDAVEKGNSGGPLLDTNGTVIGVVVGKMSFYIPGSNIETTTPVKTSSVAITLVSLKNFLKNNNVFYRTDNTLYKFADNYMENKAKDYIVNIQCIKDEADTKGASADKILPKNPS